VLGDSTRTTFTGDHNGPEDPADYAPLHCAADRPEPARTGVTPVLVFCDATRAFDNEARSFNDFTASAGHDDGHHVVLDDWG
jgi:hypothetical protein